MTSKQLQEIKNKILIDLESMQKEIDDSRTAS